MYRSERGTVNLYYKTYLLDNAYFLPKAKKLNVAVGESVDVKKIENELLANVSGKTKRFLRKCTNM